MSGRAKTRVFPVKIFLIFSEYAKRSSAVPLAVVVIIGLPFLDQLTAIAGKYIGTSRASSSPLISFQAMSTFLHSVSKIGGLN